MNDKDCKPFAHEFTYVTDREDKLLCTKCWREWSCGGNEERFHTPNDFDTLYKLRKQYKHSTSLLYKKKLRDKA